VFGNLGFGELMVIMVIVLVLFGAKRVPEISASFGKGIREFKRNLNDVEGSLMDAGAHKLDGGHRAVREDVAQPAANSDSDRPEPKRLM
jgi:sec-independent protein translocase protein TatA